MSGVTALSMHDARDEEDKRLLESGQIDLLLAGWYETIVNRCVARMRGPSGHDVAQQVCVRLWRELKSGRHRDGKWPFRVIVHKVIDFTCNGHYEPGWGESEWLEADGPAPDATAEVDTRLDLKGFVETLPPADREVAALWLAEGLDPDQIAETLGKNANAIYQARSRITKRLKEWLEQ
ncbi:MAG TPA: sigma-70 family RNA polymerase sigma factor [Gaiellaceae bacterium]|jgi:RNA polymerase sigma factor (sigma-70 family)|nr:sigma-70 family RNA polymerase sigma factor [Gaiellaceae bacterium]